MIRIRGIRTSSSLASPIKIVAFTICLPSSVTRNRIPLHNVGASKLRINKTGTPNFNSNLCGGTSDNSKQFSCPHPLHYTNPSSIAHSPTIRGGNALATVPGGKCPWAAMTTYSDAWHADLPLENAIKINKRYESIPPQAHRWRRATSRGRSHKLPARAARRHFQFHKSRFETSPRPVNRLVTHKYPNCGRYLSFSARGREPGRVFSPAGLFFERKFFSNYLDFYSTLVIVGEIFTKTAYERSVCGSSEYRFSNGFAP
ncbi:hypothetical protein EVAR_2740_1 [Eumeta japonica]|uniref:Uncharacterized protein n=1 Tax=Eumeta variegata TaxID=151549 RepID=A0A4C1T296_EUMVA|nr:hypothetical protein EVAR_2740_1 [Eumeta japonica]